MTASLKQKFNEFEKECDLRSIEQQLAKPVGPKYGFEGYLAELSNGDGILILPTDRDWVVSINPYKYGRFHGYDYSTKTLEAAKSTATHELMKRRWK